MTTAWAAHAWALHRRAKFFTDIVAPLLTYDKEIADIVDFKYVAWGNAHNTTAQASLWAAAFHSQRSGVAAGSEVACRKTC